MKIAVCVKQVPGRRCDAPHRPLDEAARPLRRGGAERLRRERGRGGAAAARTPPATARSCSSRSGPRRRSTRCGRRSRWAPTAPCSCPTTAAAGSDLVATSTRLAEGARARGAPISSSSASRPRDSDGAVLWAAVADRLRRPIVSQVAELTVADGSVARQAPDRVRLRRDRGAAACGRRGLGRDQRAALPVAQGDHGREEEAAGALSLADLGVEADRAGEAGSRTEVLALGPPPPRGETRQDRGRRQRGAQEILDFLAEKRLAVTTLVFLEHHDGELQKGSLGVLAQGGAARRRRRRRRSSAPACATSRSRPGRFGAQTVYVADDPALDAPLPQPRVDVLARLVADGGYDNVLFARRCSRPTSPRGSRPGSTPA